MSAVTDFLFGTDDEVIQRGANVTPVGQISQYENQLEGTTLPGAMQSYNTGMGMLQNLGTGQLPPAFASNFQQSIGKDVNNTVGSAISNLAKRGVVNSSSMTGAMDNIANRVSQASASNYGNNFQMLSNLANRMTIPAYNMQNLFTQGRIGLSEPAQTQVKEGSSGLLGGLAGGGFFNGLFG